MAASRAVQHSRHRWKVGWGNGHRVATCRNCGCKRRRLPDGRVQFTYLRDSGSAPRCDGWRV